MLFQAFRLWGRHRDLPARLLHEINAWVNRLIVRVGSLGTKSTESMKKSYLATYRETKNTDVIKTPDFNLLISISLKTSLEIVFLFLSTISWFKIQWNPVTTDTNGTCHCVRIKEGLRKQSRTHVLSTWIYEGTTNDWITKPRKWNLYNGKQKTSWNSLFQASLRVPAPSPLFFLCRGEGAATRRLVPGSQIVGKTRK